MSTDDPAPGGAGVHPGATAVERVCELLCGLCLLSMIALIGTEAVCRNLLGFSLEVADELGGYLLVAAGFLSLPVAQAYSAFHQVELVQNRLPPRIRLALQLTFDLLALVGSLVLAWQLVRLEIGTYRSDDVAPTLLATPLWIPRLAMPVGMVLLCFTLVRTVLLRLRLLAGTAR